MRKSGVLREISPFGTGFIEIENDRVLGFHHTMLEPRLPREQWATLEGRQIVFDLMDGFACHVRMADVPVVVSAAPIPYAATAVGSKS